MTKYEIIPAIKANGKASGLCIPLPCAVLRNSLNNQDIKKRSHAIDPKATKNDHTVSFQFIIYTLQSIYIKENHPPHR